ncbi:serine/threonine protein kinase with two-component sensor domain [Calothrix parasitica NIES-267]|uniref:histidine kinase n=1 Tax=Calothrix parasitica NIES-267 TaxID=1973488 RepID=A0A1Z4LMK1_9CYAN|nr:serine/threonine protein kinase with two-component sensor domain [Calothrix parasitica NIES-267]
MVSIQGYHLDEELYNGSRTLVYRGIREHDQKPVVIKLLKNPYPNFNELLQFRNQYTITKNLDIPGIIHPYNLEAYQSGYALVMEDFGGISLQEYITGGYTASIQDILSIILQLTDILHDIHQNRVIHKDIKPANILIKPETKQIKLIDFSIASLLPKETQEIKNPNGLEGTLAYISPEQTGRMNRGIDYRSDYYSLGVTFYQLLTGELPFKSDDAMELVHCHIAKQPPVMKPHPNPLLNKERGQESGREIPQVLSDIVMKLMAKNAEDRYQSALGLQHDLKVCLKQLQKIDFIENFEIAQRDVCDRFIIPEKLYGRENEVQKLLTVFERVSKGNSELMLVAGFSGIGKTAVVNEVHKPIVKQRGYFIKGKFDQFNRNIPFSAFVQALRNLMGQLLSESSAQLLIWKDKILQALGNDGRVIIEVIPELEIIIGQQPPASKLSGAAAQNRFNLLFQRFIQVFTTEEHPLVIFLDDLQWADSASFNLMKLLMSKSNRGYLFLIGAYRDNEVFPAHPLMLTLAEITKAEAIVNTITLSPLSEVDINYLIADAFSCSREIAQTLTNLVYQKTKGNPFFTTQFLLGLYEEGLIKFNSEAGYWECDIAEVKKLSLTDDVVEFMIGRLQKLPERTREVLKLAACIGNSFDLATLAVVCDGTPEKIASDLWSGLQESFVIPETETYKFFQVEEGVENRSNNVTVGYRFLHDRVQQAAYSFIPDGQKQATHYHIGKLLLKHIPEKERKERIFEIVNHLNLGAILIETSEEKIKLAEFNLCAARKAKAATAYQATINYLNIGIELLPSDRWQAYYKMALDYHNLLAEANFLSGNFETMQQWIDIVLQQTENLLDKVEVYKIQIYAKISQKKPLEGIQVSLKALEQLGVDLPAEPKPEDIQKALQETNALIQAKGGISSLSSLPEMTDAKSLAKMQIYFTLAPAAYILSSKLFLLNALSEISLSIEHGNSPTSAAGYIHYSIALCGVIHDINSGYEFANLALKLAEQFGYKAIQAKTGLLAGALVLPWKQHPTESFALLETSYQTGLESGASEIAAFCRFYTGQLSYVIGQELSELEIKVAIYTQQIRQTNHALHISWNEMLRQVILNLQGKSENPCRLIGDAIDEEQMLEQYQATKNNLGLFNLYLHKLILCYWFEQDTDALSHAESATQYIGGVTAQVVVLLLCFYDTLVRLRVYYQLTEAEQSQTWKQVVENQQKLERWSSHAPMNFQHKLELIKAEKSRILGEKLEAIELYDKAISGAKENGYIQEEALANELAAKFYLSWGKEKVATSYMQEAYYCYARWGAKAKTDDLEKRYPDLLRPILQQSAQTLSVLETLSQISTQNMSIHSSTTRHSSSSKGVNDTLDFATVIKASQALSKTIQLEELLCQITQIILQNSGGDFCVLILPNRDGEWYLEAIATLEETELCSEQLKNNPNLPNKLINYVRNTRKIVVVDDLNTDLPVLDEYLLQKQPKSVICLPILNQGDLVGILYLKNQVTGGVFSSDRILILDFLCTQAAISLKNGSLYKSLEESNSLLNTLLQTIPDFFFAKDLQGRHIAVNSNLAEFFGKSIAEIIGKSDIELLPKEIAEPIMAKDKEIIRTEITETFEEVLPTNGVDKTYLTVKTPLRNSQGDAVGMIGITRDITERKQAEEAVIQKSQELEKALQELKQAQLQMVQNEKMATLGNLVAGVAHEVNNPIGFLKGSISNAEDYIKDIFGHLEIYQENYPSPEEEVIENAEDIDLEYLSEDLPKLLNSMRLATERIKDISTSLRTFSRADTSEKVACNIHEGIDSTILILKYRLKANEKRPAIEIIKQYGELPLIKCFLGQLNQVFMNIIANAIDALDTASEGKTFNEIQENPHKITIKTELNVEENTVLIRLRDNGSGMPESIRERIFDNLFTTKGVGKGTGLGLAIAKQIVEETHDGKLSCDSVLGEGTEFVIELPIC